MSEFYRLAGVSPLHETLDAFVNTVGKAQKNQRLIEGEETTSKGAVPESLRNVRSEPPNDR